MYASPLRVDLTPIRLLHPRRIAIIVPSRADSGIDRQRDTRDPGRDRRRDVGDRRGNVSRRQNPPERMSFGVSTQHLRQEEGSWSPRDRRKSPGPSLVRDQARLREQG